MGWCRVNLPLAITFMYLMFGMVVTAVGFSIPGVTDAIKGTIEEAEGDDNVQKAVLTVLTVIFVVFWPVLLYQMLNPPSK